MLMFLNDIYICDILFFGNEWVQRMKYRLYALWFYVRCYYTFYYRKNPLLRLDNSMSIVRLWNSTGAKNTGILIHFSYRNAGIESIAVPVILVPQYGVTKDN